MLPKEILSKKNLKRSKIQVKKSNDPLTFNSTYFVFMKTILKSG